MPDLDVKIVRTEQTTTFDPTGGPLGVYRVHFKVGEHGPFQEDFRPAEFIPETIRQRLDRVASTIRGLQ